MINSILGRNLRTANANKNIIYSLLLKGINIITQFCLVPITLHYLSASQYGVWLTISSILLWLSFFDIGLGNGLRNRLSEALAQKNIIRAKILVSTSYALVSIIFLCFMVLFWIINPFINWADLLNTPKNLDYELKTTLLVVVSFSCIQFISGLISNILYANQQVALNNLILPLSNLLSLLIIYLLTISVPRSLFWTAFALSSIPVFVLLSFNIILFTTKYKHIAPEIKCVDFTYTNKLMNLGVQFFLIQIASLINYLCSNIIISHLFGPESVTIYNIAYKYFTVGVMLNGIICNTYWSAFTEAFVKHDFVWIKQTIKKLDRITFSLIGFTVLTAFFTDFIISYWIKSSIVIPDLFKISMCISAGLALMSTPQNMFVNGTGKIRLQTLISVFSILAFVPLSILFSKTLFGPAGVAIAMIIVTLPTTFLVRIQSKKILAGTARGIWNS